METLEQQVPRATDETVLIWLGIILGFLFLIYLSLKIVEVWHYEIIDWRKDNKAGRFMLENLALVSTETLEEELDLLQNGSYKYSRELSIRLFTAIPSELKRRNDKHKH